jgi:LPS export ABC transporter protein LptC
VKTVAAVVLLMYRLCFAQDIPRPNPVPTAILFQGTSYSAYSGSDKMWDLHADHIQGTPERAKATDVHGTLYRKGKIRYRLESKLAYINSKTTDIYFPDGAIFRSPTGEDIKVRVLLWKAREKKFFGSKGVEVHHLNTWLQGDRMVLDQSYNSVKLEGHVKSVATP